MRVVLAYVALAATVGGCAAPNTPGAGAGKNYTPIVDMRGIDHARYLDDLNGCRSSAAMIDADRQELYGVLGGALLGAAIGASISPNSRVINAGANSGAISGGGHAGARARSRQELVMGNCMVAKGYRVLDGTANVAYVQMAGPSPAPLPATPAPLPLGASSSQEMVPTPAAKPSAVGKDSFVAERFAKESGCTRDTLASMIGKGPGYESYSFQCLNGETLVVRCEFGNCRALR